MRRRLRLLAWCALVIVVVTMLGSFATSYMVRAIADRVAAERDAEFGASELAKLRVEWSFLEDSNAVAQVVAMTDPLLRALPGSAGTNGYRFHVIRHKDPNAFALPGGHVVITTAMLELADTEELLGVLAHEIAHVNQRHIYRQAIGAAGPLTLCSVFMGRSQLGRIMGGGAALLIGAGFSQEYEAEADEVGWEYLIKANVDPRGMIRLFGKLQGIEAKEGFDPTPQAFRSHPATAKRIRLLEARWSKLRRQSGFLELPPGGFDFKTPRPGG
jgi:predicted Zn-dependent protease